MKNFYFIDFLTFSKTVKHGFQNCSLRVHRNSFRKLSEARVVV